MKYILCIALLLAVAANAHGQTGFLAFHYNISIPAQDFTNYIDETSWIGGGFDARWFVSPDKPIALGLASSWHVFDQEMGGTMMLPNGALTGKQHRYINSFPIVATAHYYFGDQSKVWAFIGGGVGTYYVLQRFEIGVMSFEQGNWHFGAYPEFGVQIPFRQADLFLSGRYNCAFEAGESLSGEAKAYYYASFQIGVAYRQW
jgi:hypothetical protein